MQRLMQRTPHGSIATKTLGLVAACLLLISRPAAASSEYPVLLKSTWGVTKLPVAGADGCQLCHTTDPGMLGTANQKFAKTLKSFGLQAKNDGALQAALDKNKTKATDSDGDGFSDYEEIVLDSTNPNDAGSHAAPMPMGSGGSGTVSVDPDDAGVIPEAGGAPDEVSAGGSDGTEEIPGESLGQCTTRTEKIYPTLGHGCSFGGGSAGSNPTMLVGLVAAYLIRRGARAGKRRREPRGNRT